MSVMGGQTVVLREFTKGATRTRLNRPELEHSDSVVSGCLMRPFRPTETVALTTIATEVWRCTCPGDHPGALAATTNGELLYGGNTFQISGVEPFYDLNGAVNHVRITCQRQVS